MLLLRLGLAQANTYEYQECDKDYQPYEVISPLHLSRFFQIHLCTYYLMRQSYPRHVTTKFHP